MFNKILCQRKAQLEGQINLIEKSIKEREQYLANINFQVERKNQNLNEIQYKLIKFRKKLDERQRNFLLKKIK